MSNAPLKILLVIRRLNERVGGAERLFCDTANLFAEAGYEVMCLHCESTPGRPYYPLSSRVTLINLYGTEARRSPWYRMLARASKSYARTRRPSLAPLDWLSKNLYFVRRLYAAMRGFQPDVVISFLPPANTPTLLAGALARARVIPTNHNVPERDYESTIRWDQNPLDKLLRRWMLHAADRVHVIFPGFGDWFPGAIQKKIVVVNNYVSPEFEDVAATEPRRREVIAAGRLDHAKGYMAFVDAWAQVAPRFPTWRAKIYGDGPLRDQLQARIDELGIADSFELAGNANDMKRRYLQAEILCHPALHEGFGLSVAEALACGLPVVAYSDCAGVNEYVEDGHNGILVDREHGAAALAAGIARLIEDEQLRDQLRSRAPASVAAFNRQAFLERWRSILAELAPEGAPA